MIKAPLFRIIAFLLILISSGYNASAQQADSTEINKLIDKATELLNNNELDNALREITKAEKAAKTIQWKQGLLKIYARKSSIQNVYNRHYEAIATGLKGYELSRELADKYYEVLFNRSLANNYDMLDNYKEAIPYYQKCLAVSVNVPSAAVLRGHCFVEIGDAYRLYLKKPAKARELIQAGINIYREKSPEALGYAYDYLGEALTDLKLYTLANETFLKSRKIYEQNKEFYLIPELLFHHANLFLVQRKYKEAITLAKEGVAYSQKMNTIYGESEAHKVLYLAYKKSGSPAKALEHFEFYTALRDSLTKVNVDNRFAQVETEVQLQKQESRIKELQLQQQNNLLKSQKYLLYFLLFTLLLSGLFAYYFIRQSRKLKLKNSKISEALLIGETTERQRIALQVRDSIGSGLSSAIWGIDLLVNDKMTFKEKELIAKLKKELEKTYKSVTLLSQNLRPEELENKGLVPALKALVRKTNLSSGSNFTMSIHKEFLGTEPKIEFEVYYIFLELILLSNKIIPGKEVEFGIERMGKYLKLYYKAEDEGKILLSDDDHLKKVFFRIETLDGKINRLKSENNNTVLIVQIKV